MDNFVVQIDETMGLLCNLDRVIDAKCRDYGCGFELSAREIHTLEILGNYHLLYDSFSPGYGFDGIPIALLANGNPYGCIVGGLLFGALRAGAQNMQIVTGVNKEIVTVIQGLLVTLIGAEFMIRYFLKKLSFRKVGSKT